MPPVNSLASAGTGQLVRDPVYQQLTVLLQQLIRSGEFRPGQRFLTERSVSERFGVSRVTANKALSHLVVSGTLEFRKGVGTFVREGVLDCDLQSLLSFTRRAMLAGRRPETRVLRFEALEANQAEGAAREALQVAGEESLYYFERLRLADGEPLILERRYLPARFCPGLNREALEGSLYALLTDTYGLPVSASDQTIQAVNLASAEARLLRVPVGSAALRILAVGRGEVPLWWEATLYRGDCYEFHNALRAAESAKPASLVICGQGKSGEEESTN